MDNKWLSAVIELKSTLARASKDKELQSIIDAQDEVLARYRPVFSREHIPNLTQEEFSSFLSFNNNKHWTGLNRNAGKLMADMDALRQAL